MTLSVSNLERSLNEALKLFVSASFQPTEALTEAIARAVRCEWATYWWINPAAQKLYCASLWIAPELENSKLKVDTQNRTLSLSEGLAGQVWKSQQPFYSNNLEMEMALPRSLQARKEGFRNGVWIPVQSQTQVYGVIEVLRRSTLGEPEKMLTVMNESGRAMGEAKFSNSNCH